MSLEQLERPRGEFTCWRCGSKWPDRVCQTCAMDIETGERVGEPVPLAPAPSVEPVPDPTAAAPREWTCRTCFQRWPEPLCRSCGIDLETGDLAAVPEGIPTPERDGTRPLRREQAALEAEIPSSWREILRRGALEATKGPVGTLACFLLVTFALQVQGAKLGSMPLIPWTGQLAATFVLSFLLVEHARAAHEGERGAIGSSGHFDPSAIGSTLLTSVCLVPLLAGVFASNPIVGAAVGVPAALILPGILGAVTCDRWDELVPSRIQSAILRTPSYLATALLASLSLALGLAAVWLPEGFSLPRAAGATAFVALSGSLSGLMRRDAETMIEP